MDLSTPSHPSEILIILCKTWFLPTDVHQYAWGYMDTNPKIGYLDCWILDCAWSDVQLGLDSTIRGRDLDRCWRAGEDWEELED